MTHRAVFKQITQILVFQHAHSAAPKHAADAHDVALTQQTILDLRITGRPIWRGHPPLRP